ncbi:MAG: cobalt-precorrin-5B (C(1))-methyltransferase [Paracoccaceae bacterium]
MDSKDPSKLRTGWTTGACATAAARAACFGLLTGNTPDRVQITLPRGQTPEFRIEDSGGGPEWSEATVRKDAGDDPDVTHLALITVRVAIARAGTGIAFHAGEGVGTVTKPGLPIPPGEPAINPVPRQMITETLHEVAVALGATADFDVTISVPGGSALSRKTWNPRLGIEGGISILGTTGIVRPFSCAAWIASIHRGIDVARATGLEHAMGATGATSEAAVRTHYALPETACLDMGDFAGGLLKYLRTHPIPRLTIAGGIGKMTKLGQGALDLHSGRSQVNFAKLAALTGVPEVADANTALDALSMAGGDMANAVAGTALGTIRNTLRDAPIKTEVIIVDRSGKIIAQAGS